MGVSTLAVTLLCILPASSLRLATKEEQGDIYSQVSISCKMTVNTKERMMHLTTDIGNFVVKNGQVYDENDKVVGKSTPKPMICESDTGSVNNTHSFLLVGSSASYLWSYLNPFFNKHCYAKQNQMTYYLWFGEVNNEISTLYKNKDPDAAKCSGGLGSPIHYFYPIGMKKIFDNKPNLKWLVSMDLSDAFFNGAHFADNSLRRVLTDDLSDVAFAAQLGATRTFVNGALWAIKNTEWSKQWLADVYKNRCGNMNQLSYWHTLLQHWKKENPSFEYNENSMTSYNGARGYMPSVAWKMLSTAQQEVFHKYRSDSNNLLREPLYFGKHMMILPNGAPAGTDPTEFLGFRGNRDGGEPLMCHRPMAHKMFLQFDDKEEQEFDFDSDMETHNSNNCLREKRMCTGGGSCMCDA